MSLRTRLLVGLGVVALVLGLLNTLVRPVLVLLTFPITLLTLGLFLFVINALMFWAAAQVLDGFGVAGFAAALIGSLIYSLCGMVIDVAMERLRTTSSRRLDDSAYGPCVSCCTTHRSAPLLSSRACASSTMPR